MVNSVGLRDDEASLVAPEVIVLGDSFAMGWGIGQEETFSQRLEKESRLKVLNAGISSFGTVREMRLLSRLDTSHVKYVVIQYCNNDRRENDAFYRNKNQFEGMTFEKYRSVREDYLKRRHYYFGRYTYENLRKTAQEIKAELLHTPPETEPSSQTGEVELFLNALQNAGRFPLKDVRLIVFEVNSYGRKGGEFCRLLQEHIAHSQYPAFIQTMRVVDLSKTLNPIRDYYLLDDHLTPMDMK